MIKVPTPKVKQVKGQNLVSAITQKLLKQIQQNFIER